MFSTKTKNEQMIPSNDATELTTENNSEVLSSSVPKRKGKRNIFTFNLPESSIRIKASNIANLKM